MSSPLTSYNQKLVINTLKKLNQIWITTDNKEQKEAAEQEIINITHNELLLLRSSLISNQMLFFLSVFIALFSVSLGLFFQNVFFEFFSIAVNPALLILLIDFPLYGFLIYRYFTLKSLFLPYDTITAGKTTYFNDPF